MPRPGGRKKTRCRRIGRAKSRAHFGADLESLRPNARPEPGECVCGHAFRRFTLNSCLRLLGLG